ncbi:MAG: preprotein translocase subunit YajC [Pirellulales bacterium]|nr:preprotein translocase subunit YajC [Pirellulales bacterium]
MYTLILAIWLFAEGEGGEGNGGGGLFGPINPLILMAIMLAFYFIVMRPARDERQRRTLLDGLKKNDRIVTSSGIKATIASINRDKNEAVLTIDKTTKAQMTISIDAINHVVVDENKKSEGDKE